MKNYLLLYTLLLFTCISCKKYEDGPAFSIKTKKMRLCREWKLTNFVSLDGHVTSSPPTPEVYDLRTLNLKKDGNMNFRVGNDLYIGKWDFSRSKSNIILTFGTTSISFKILRLTSEELWVEDFIGYQTHMKCSICGII